MSCKSKSSLDVDNISGLIIPKTMNYVIKPLVHIFNLCFERDEFLDKIKTCKYYLYSKRGNKLYAQFLFYHKYSMILWTTLPNIGKIMSSIMLSKKYVYFFGDAFIIDHLNNLVLIS